MSIKMTDADKARLKKWKEEVQSDENAYQEELTKMDEREEIYNGTTTIKPLVTGDTLVTAPYVRNIVKELIECQINSEIPQPKVIALKKENEELAKLIEDMLRNKLLYLPFPGINDQMERTAPTQGGAGVLLEWDDTQKYGRSWGNQVVSMLHPKQIIPQAGVTSDIEDMDRVTVLKPQTKQYIKRAHGVDVSGEEDPDVRSANGDYNSATDMVTQKIEYFRNDKGGIGKRSWVNDVILDDMDDYQARHLRRCRNCGEPEPVWDVDILPPTLDGTLPDADMEIIRKTAEERKGRCPHCGGTFKDTEDEFMEFPYDITSDNKVIIPAGTKVPYYKPDVFPVFLRKNISRYGKFLGDSDVDMISDHQNAMNRLYAKTFYKTLAGGSYIIKPNDVKIKQDSADGKAITVDSPEQANMLKAVSLEMSVSQDVSLIDHIYDEAMKALGISDSFLGRKDTTATSGKAKEFSAAQAAGRLESKRVMKNDMFARLFEAMFKFELAYADEPRPVIGEDARGNATEQEWNKFLFLKFDESGKPYWEDGFLFTVDSAAPLASNREAMWQETRSHFESGAYGIPQEIETQIIYWSTMALLHYPGAERAKQLLSERQTKQTKQNYELSTAKKEAMAAAESAVPEMIPGMLGGETQ